MLCHMDNGSHRQLEASLLLLETVPLLLLETLPQLLLKTIPLLSLLLLETERPNYFIRHYFNHFFFGQMIIIDIPALILIYMLWACIKKKHIFWATNFDNYNLLMHKKIPDSDTNPSIQIHQVK